MDTKDPFHYTTLHNAAENGAVNAVCKLTSLKASLELPTRMHNCRPSHYAAEPKAVKPEVTEPEAEPEAAEPEVVKIEAIESEDALETNRNQRSSKWTTGTRSGCQRC